MWNKDKSIVLSQILVKIGYVFVAVCVIAAPRLVEVYETILESRNLPSMHTPLLITIYACVLPEGTALVCLDMLLRNIKKSRTFVSQNVKLLRILSFCCFGVAGVFVYFSVYYPYRPFTFLIVFATAFLGIILRVVKNCFQQAIAIRKENDFTI